MVSVCGCVIDRDGERKQDPFVLFKIFSEEDDRKDHSGIGKGIAAVAGKGQPWQAGNRSKIIRASGPAFYTLIIPVGCYV